jgi:hypothetical protein
MTMNIEGAFTIEGTLQPILENMNGDQNAS